MQTVLLTVALLVLAASLGSWLFSQYLRVDRRTSALTLVLGGIGFVLLIGATALSVIATSTGWQTLLPQFEWADERTQAPASAPVVVANFGSAEQWPATTCLTPLHATSSVPRRWFIDNDCERSVAVMLAWCDESQSVCAAGASQAAWRYEPSGIVMTGAMSKPIARRMPERDAPIGGTYSLIEADGATLRVRYLACYLAEPAVVALAQDSLGTEEFQRTLLMDECYARVAEASKVGMRSGQPPIISAP